MKARIGYIVLIISILVCLCCYVPTSAQCPSQQWDAANRGNEYIDPLGIKAYYGNFTNLDDAQQVNDGRVHFFGDITNLGHMGDGFGHEHILTCGEDTTTISGSGSTEFNNVEINNPNGVFLRNTLRVKENITFSNGIIHTDRSKFAERLYFQEGAVYRRASNSKHVNGRITRQGTGKFKFPLGDGDHMGEITITAQNTTDVFTAAYYSENLDPTTFEAEGRFDRSSLDWNVAAVQKKEHWTLRGSQNTAVTLHFTNYSQISELSPNVMDYIVVGWDGEKWVNLGQTKVEEAFGQGAVTSDVINPRLYQAYTFGVQDMDGDGYADATDADPLDPCVPDPTLPACTDRLCVQIDTKVWLEGAMKRGFSSNNMEEMRCDINYFGYLPGQEPSTLLGTKTDPGQPYRGVPWNYNGTEGMEYDIVETGLAYSPDVVDWVLVSLRSDVSPESTICTKSAMLLKDGTVQMETAFDCCSSDFEEFYIVIEHRNHLPVMTPTPMPVVDGVISFDFRSNDSYTRLLGRGQKEIRPGVYAMFAGNGDQRLAAESAKDINANDVSLWALDNGKHSGYYQQDYDLNGDVNVHDKAIWLKNNGIFTDVER